MVVTPEHTVSIFKKWANEREELERGLGVRLNKNNVVELMIHSVKDWSVIRVYIT